MARLTGKNALICGDAGNIKITAPFDITGYTLKLTVKGVEALSSDSDSGAVMQLVKSVHSGPSDDPAKGVTYLPYTSENSRVTPGRYVFDVQFDDGSPDSPISSRKQEIEFTQDVTKS